MRSAIYPDQKPWSQEAAQALLDMSGGLPGFEKIGSKQLDAAIALHRMLITQGVGYLADEVGMGKTYVALAVVALCRHLQPGFRVLYLAPSRNVMRKWHEREFPAFIRNNVAAPDMRVRGLAGQSPGQTLSCQTVDDWVHHSVACPTALDVFLTFSALSFPLTGDEETWSRRLEALAKHAGIPIELGRLSGKPDAKQRASKVLNQIIPYYDLVVIDEAHLLKNGGSDRAQFLAQALGTPGSNNERRFGGVLLLSGTPFDRDLMQLARQLELFARPDLGIKPHETVKDLAEARRKGKGWREVQAGLKPFMVRRVQQLEIGREVLSRNQYRTERRQEAGITLDDRTDPEQIKQRLFCAVVQKRLIDFLEDSNGGRFPTAMFASWEAYSPVAPHGKSQKNEATVNGSVSPEKAVSASNGELDVSHESGSNSESKALDSQLLSDILDSYRQVFVNEEPPHPKLESEAKRLSQEAFGLGLKQLVFVRRLKSIDDLYSRLNQAYDRWLVDYLASQGCASWAEALPGARNRGVRDKRTSMKGVAPVRSDSNPESEAEPEADSLFGWFFRGKLDGVGEEFVGQRQLPRPWDLRALLRNPNRTVSIIGELDWRGFLADRLPSPRDVSYGELARRAERIPGSSDPVEQYRRLQIAWLELQAESRVPAESAPLNAIALYTRTLLDSQSSDRPTISESRVKDLIDMPTFALAFYQANIGVRFLPAWDQCWRSLSETKHNLTDASLRNLDLQREIQFALLRLDHPFIDLYLAWLKADRQSDRLVAEALVNRVVSLCEQPDPSVGFGTASILNNLALAWDQIVKTNFSDMLHGSARVKRDQWRIRIHTRLSPFAPVEFASGDNTNNRTAIARRFRMPGYPMALVSTSVLQEGEDLHVCCDRVTHFGISGSPIGIEQKNGRVDRIGSRAHRRLIKGDSLEDAAIQVAFPHLTESLEWYQIRDLGIAINEYLRSLHEMGSEVAPEEQTLTQSLSDQTPIPPLLKDSLESPFEPEIPPLSDCIQPKEVTDWLKAISSKLEHARELVRRVAAEAGFTGTADPDCFEKADAQARLILQPAYLIGEIKVLAERRLKPGENPDWLCNGKLCLEASVDLFQTSMANPMRQHRLERIDNGWALNVIANCFAHGDGQLHVDEIRDLLWRIDCLEAFSPPDHSTDKLNQVLQQLKKSREYGDFAVPESSSPALHRLHYRGTTITLVIWKSWVVATRPIESCPDASLSMIIDRTIARNAKLRGPDFFLGKQNQVKARMVHPLADLGVPELVSMVKELVAILQ